MRKLLLPALALSLTLSFQSCKKDEDKGYDVPTTYNFTNVDYSGQTYRLAMLSELSTEMKKGNTMGTTVSAQVLLNMYANTNNPFANDTLNTSGKKLKDKTFASEQTVIEGLLNDAATASQSGVAASNGQAGVVTSGTSKYLVGANGMEYTQLVEKGLMGSLIYYQITAVYLSEDKIGSQVALADRQHHWDEAFGYYGVPADFPTTTTGTKFIGKYCNDRNALLSTNAAIMNAYLKGRAAINNGDDATVSAQVIIIRENLEKVLAGTAVHYINEALANASNDAVRNHTLSEGIAFVQGLKYNPTKKATDAQITQLLTYFGNNFYTVNTTHLQAAKDLLSTIYGFDSIKDQL
jgi:hypothetical protein